MTAAMAIGALCGVLLAAMTLWYGVRIGRVPLARRMAAAAIPASQASAVIAFDVFMITDASLAQFVPYVVIATAVCLIVDGLALPNLSLGARRETAKEQACSAAELLAAASQGASDARREAQEAEQVRSGMAQMLKHAIERCDLGEAIGEGELTVGRPFARYCRNDVVDGLLALKARRAADEGVAFEIHADVPAVLAIDEVDLCAIFSNMLDNGINGAMAAEGDRFVRLDAGVRGPMLVVQVVNSCSSKAAMDRRATTDRRLRRGVSSHGWGLDILTALAARYGGSFQTETENGRWTASLMVKCG